MNNIEAELAAKHKNLNVSNPVQAIKEYVKVRPVGCKTKALIQKDLQGFQFIISKVPEKQFPSFISSLTELECEYIIDYLHRYMQFVGQTEGNITSGSLLGLYDKIVSAHGPSIIVNAISREDTIISRIQNY